jgi:hypothetical protein
MAYNFKNIMHFTTRVISSSVLHYKSHFSLHSCTRLYLHKNLQPNIFIQGDQKSM